ncbi:MAG: 30S ribosomal protein S17 [bacterium]
MSKKRYSGKVVSNKMTKTIVVEVESVKEHPKYKRHYLTHKKYKAHTEKGVYNIGDKVIIEECRPISKDKKWQVVSIDMGDHVV